jgi:hypothetical protein
MCILTNNNKQIFFSDGSVEPILAGPMYTEEQGRTGFDTISLTDTFGIDRSVARFSVGNNTVALVAQQTFTAAASIENNELLGAGFTTAIKSGWNISTTYPNFMFNGTASIANQLVDSSTSIVYSPTDFLLRLQNNTAVGTLHIKNDGGITYGLDSDFVTRIEGNSTVFRNRITDSIMRFQVKDGLFDKDAIYIKAISGEDYRVGVWTNTPQYDFDINGDLRVAGNLVVDGDTTTLDVATLKVEDMNIEIANTASPLVNAALDGAGIIILGADSNKTILYNATNNSMNISEDINLANGKGYQINDVTILNDTTLASSVTSATGLTTIGTLEELNVDSITLDGSTVSSNATSLVLKSTAAINITDELGVSGAIRIRGVADPTTDQDVATKVYVDTRDASKNESFAVDITGLTDTNIAALVEDLFPSANKELGVYCYVHCVSYAGEFSYNASDGITKTFIAVDKNGVENQSVLADVGFTEVGPTAITLTPTRSFKRFRVTSPIPDTKAWEFDTDLPSSV